ncbi:Outer membrane protein assembly factor BamB [subsurface metagenome]
MRFFKNLKVISLVLFTLSLVNLNCNRINDAGWPTFRSDNTHSGITAAQIKTPLALSWVYTPAHLPKPAWSVPAEELERAHFDKAYHVVVSNEIVFYGSSVDNKIYALNAGTGIEKWAFYTEGPVRCAPTFWENKLFFGSDDGYVYCLNAKNGNLIWKFRAGPSDEKVLGNGRMISRWPVRTNVIIDDNTLYFGAGVFPYEGIFIYALNPNKDGTIIWKNDTMGDRPHELKFGGISPQGYLVASNKTLFVPNGRSMPAAFDKKDGSFLHYYALSAGKFGGTWALFADSTLIAGVDDLGISAKVALDENTGERIDDVHAWIPGMDMVYSDKFSYTLTENGIYAIDRDEYERVQMDREALNKQLQTQQRTLSQLRRRLFLGQDAEGSSDSQLMNDLLDLLNAASDTIYDLMLQEDKLKASLFKWRYDRTNLNTLIHAGNLIFAGGNGFITAIDSDTGEEIWNDEVKGVVCGLAATQGKLFASSDNGQIYCFSSDSEQEYKEVIQEKESFPFPDDELAVDYKNTAKQIIHDSGVEKGYCLILGDQTGQLAFELAQITDLNIICLEKDPRKLEKAKKILDAAGLYGSRIVIEPWEISSLPDYFANLIVSDSYLSLGKVDYPANEISRVLRPYGGIVYLRQPSQPSDEYSKTNLNELTELFTENKAVVPVAVQNDSSWSKWVRGEMEGAGSWTHQYGNPQNTACSDDELVKGTLAVLWYGDPGPLGMVERHAKSTSPIAMDGCLFVQGEEKIMAIDSYNGTLLWEQHIPGAVRVKADVDGGNMAMTKNALFISSRDKCYHLDPTTGQIIRVYKIPSSAKGRWGHVSCEGNILYGSVTAPLNQNYAELLDVFCENGKWKSIDQIPEEFRTNYNTFKAKYPSPGEEFRKELQRSGILWRYMIDWPRGGEYRIKNAVTEGMIVSDKIFAIDINTGEILWLHQGKRIAHITISAGEGKMFFAESAISENEKRNALLNVQELVRRGKYEEYEESELDYDDRDVRKVIALNAKTGEKLWEKTVDLTGCCGDRMGSAYHKEVLMFFGQFGNHDAWRWKAGELKWRRITALSVSQGDFLWSRPLNYSTRPLIVNDQIIIEPRACDYLTGEIITREHPITGQQVPWEFLRPGPACSAITATPNMLSYRSQSTALYDLEGDKGVTHFGAYRSSCWISTIPSNGLLLSPEASSGCTCGFPIKCSVVLAPKKNASQPWSVYVTHGPMTPVKNFSINFGPPGDMKDDENTVWFAYPNPRTDLPVWSRFPNHGVKFDLQEEIYEGMGFFSSDFRGKVIKNSNKPWLFTSGCIGLKSIEVPLIDDLMGEQPAEYTVRLGFSARVNDKKGKRIFDVLLQGEHVLNDFEILSEAGGPEIAIVKEFKNIPVDNILKVVMRSKKSTLTASEAPLINYIEIIRQDPIQITEIQKKPISETYAIKLLETAKDPDLEKTKALVYLHNVLNAAQTNDLKYQALEGMKKIADPSSLTQISCYIRDTDPVLSEYQETSEELKNLAAEVYVAIAGNLMLTDKQKGARMLQYALAFSNDELKVTIEKSLKSNVIN